MLDKYNQDDYFLIETYYTNLATTGQRSWKTKLAKDIIVAATTITATGLQKPSIDTILLETYSSLIGEAVTIDPVLEHIILNRVIIYGKPDIVELLAQLLNKY